MSCLRPQLHLTCHWSFNKVVITLSQPCHKLVKTWQQINSLINDAVQHKVPTCITNDTTWHTDKKILQNKDGISSIWTEKYLWTSKTSLQLQTVYIHKRQVCWKQQPLQVWFPWSYCCNRLLTHPVSTKKYEQIEHSFLYTAIYMIVLPFMLVRHKVLDLFNMATSSLTCTWFQGVTVGQKTY